MSEMVLVVSADSNDADYEKMEWKIKLDDNILNEGELCKGFQAITYTTFLTEWAEVLKTKFEPREKNWWRPEYDTSAAPATMALELALRLTNETLLGVEHDIVHEGMMNWIDDGYWKELPNQDDWITGLTEYIDEEDDIRSDLCYKMMIASVAVFKKLERLIPFGEMGVHTVDEVYYYPAQEPTYFYKR